MFRDPRVRLALQTDYALRTLIYLAGAGERSTVQAVADFYRISSDHVAKVVAGLSRLGYIRSIRGIGGGIELGRPAAAIRLGDVILAFEGNLHLLECVGREGVCVIESFCKLKQVLAGAERMQLDYLNRTTLADLLPTRRQLNRVDDILLESPTLIHRTRKEKA
jgi:Rrf2 family transcriptional regulator, nitric oxide-sensitive transcriptional repressor